MHDIVDVLCPLSGSISTNRTKEGARTEWRKEHEQDAFQKENGPHWAHKEHKQNAKEAPRTGREGSSTNRTRRKQPQRWNVEHDQQQPEDDTSCGVSEHLNNMRIRHTISKIKRSMAIRGRRGAITTITSMWMRTRTQHEQHEKKTPFCVAERSGHEDNEASTMTTKRAGNTWQQTRVRPLVYVYTDYVRDTQLKTTRVGEKCTCMLRLCVTKHETHATLSSGPDNTQFLL